MKVDREFLEKMLKQSLAEMEKAKSIFERNQGVLNFCQFLLKDLDKEIQNADDHSGVKVEPAST